MSELAVTQYTKVLRLAPGAPPSFLPAGTEAARVRSYQIWEDLYDLEDSTFLTVDRGGEDRPVILPTPKTVVETVNRYFAPGFSFAADPMLGSTNDQVLLTNALTELFRRERFWSKFAANKRMGLIRGDWCWHIYANPAKPQGSRISIQALYPGSYFPVYHPNDPDRMIAAHIFEQIETAPGSGKYVIKRQTYQKGVDPINNDGTDTTIWSYSATFELENWWLLNAKPVTVLRPSAPLPPQITSIPIYHIPNQYRPPEHWGRSEMDGLEFLFADLSQGITDAAIALAYQGLGMFVTDSGRPVDDDGNDTDWVLGPGRVVEVNEGRSFSRVGGIDKVTPVLDVYNAMRNEIREAWGLSDVAVGRADAQTAESGIALLLQLGPILSKCAEKEQIVTDVHNQMFYDLRGWLSAFETINVGEAVVNATYGDAIPLNKTKELADILLMVESKIMSLGTARKRIAELGYEFDPNEAALVEEEQRGLSAAADPFGSRLAAEAG